eukprot:4578127-Pleurochrysis_carterae.AAC.1
MQCDVDSDSAAGLAELFTMPSAFYKPLSASELAMLAASDSEVELEPSISQSQPASSSSNSS